MRKRCVALVLCLLTRAALAGCGESSAKTVTSNGVECYRVDGVCYPAVFGEPHQPAVGDLFYGNHSRSAACELG